MKKAFVLLVGGLLCYGLCLTACILGQGDPYVSFWGITATIFCVAGIAFAAASIDAVLSAEDDR